MRGLVFVLVGVAVLALAACSSDDGGGTTASTGSTSATGSNAGESGATGDADCADLTGEGATFTITIADFAYDPPCFIASASQGISIVNEDDVDHTFTMTGTQIDVPVAAGETFNGEPISGAVEPGTYDFLCTIHPEMTGQVTVVA
ncbi:MAG TPA: cupredoxin domain-containing protein [Actinomycetota bacterium]|nr:cupredoxin domain-containing protein [Actinomycetota bacterium]